MTFMTFASAALVGLTLFAGCAKPQNDSPAPQPSASAWKAFLPAPCDDGKITALLEGLTPGDWVEGFAVAQVGGVNKDGVIPIVFVKDELAVTIVVAERSDDPKPPASSAKYGVYYQRFDGLKMPPSDKVMQLTREITARLKRTEDKVALPNKLQPLPRPTQPT